MLSPTWDICVTSKTALICDFIRSGVNPECRIVDWDKEKPLQSLPHAPPETQGSLRKKRLEDWKSQRWSMTTRKQCLLDTTGQLNKRPCSVYNSNLWLCKLQRDKIPTRTWKAIMQCQPWKGWGRGEWDKNTVGTIFKELVTFLKDCILLIKRRQCRVLGFIKVFFPASVVALTIKMDTWS